MLLLSNFESLFCIDGNFQAIHAIIRDTYYGLQAGYLHQKTGNNVHFIPRTYCNSKAVVFCPQELKKIEFITIYCTLLFFENQGGLWGT